VTIKDQIQKIIDDHAVVLFMKGNKLFPQCGFSGKVVHILNETGVDFKDINVLESEEMRQGIKDFSNWPTIPQLYIKGEFIGGCDIVTQLAQTGELMLALKDVKK
jgi:monothiol glutaredoxin